MVIGVKELDTRVAENEKGRIAALERRIDKALESNFNGSSVTIAVSSEDPRNYVRNNLFDQYRRAGWNVQVVSDWRDGDYYQFSPRRESSSQMSHIGPYGYGTSFYDR